MTQASAKALESLEEQTCLCGLRTIYTLNKLTGPTRGLSSERLCSLAVWHAAAIASYALS